MHLSQLLFLSAIFLTFAHTRPTLPTEGESSLHRNSDSVKGRSISSIPDELCDINLCKAQCAPQNLNGICSPGSSCNCIAFPTGAFCGIVGCGEGCYCDQTTSQCVCEEQPPACDWVSCDTECRIQEQAQGYCDSLTNQCICSNSAPLLRRGSSCEAATCVDGCTCDPLRGCICPEDAGTDLIDNSFCEAAKCKEGCGCDPTLKRCVCIDEAGDDNLKDLLATRVGDLGGIHTTFKLKIPIPIPTFTKDIPIKNTPRPWPPRLTPDPIPDDKPWREVEKPWKVGAPWREVVGSK